MSLRYDADGLTAFAKSLLEKMGLPSERAAVVADILVEGGKWFQIPLPGSQLFGLPACRPPSLLDDSRQRTA